MSLIDRTKEFFGLGPMDIEADDAYYADERSYEPNGSAAYAPRSFEPALEEEFVPTIVALSLVSFDDAAKVGAPFRDGDAVVFELTDADKASAKRFVDFAAGLCFGLEGRMLNLTKGMDTDRRVFAIVPKGADISTLELERAAHLR
ncbi:cell division protein SepF [Corynebacterium striatum]|uniref:cell division protein SepF n=1 Tax=Corynebacterium striatum TaxID=43770 RepID=UPI001A2B9F00|nr:cell division protein SepF [Corynebacterium striatum]MDK8812116.1 cell division protein SepF [Corynebacterium striatum]HAT1547831.1 cell division protein SepF [Corynebacterium striatum]